MAHCPDPGRTPPAAGGVSRPGSALRTAAQVAAIVGALVVVLGGLLALEAWNEQRTDGVPTASGAAGIAVSADTRLGVSAEGSGADSGTRDFIWQLGARPELLGHFPGGAPLVFAPDSWTVLAASPAGVTEWSLANPARPVRRATMPGPGMAQGIAYAPDRTTVAVAYARAVVLWDLANPAAPNRIATIPVTADVAGPDVAPHFQSQIAFSPDGRMLATTTARRTVSLWDVSTPSAPRYLMTVGSDTGPVAALAFSPAGSQLAYLSETGAVTVADLTDPARPVRAAPLPVASASPFSPAPSALRYSSDGTRLIAAALGGDQYRDRAVCTWNVTDLSRPLAARCRTDHVQVEGAIAFTPDGTAIVEPDPRGANKPSNTLSIWPVHA